MKYFLIHVLMPVVLGLCIYLFFRSDSTNFEAFTEWHLKKLEGTNLIIVKCLLGSIPDFLWCYALLSSLTIVWKGTFNIPKKLLYGLYIIVPLTEILQYYHLLQGTADIFDFVAYIIAMIVHFFYTKTKTVNYEKH